MKFIFPIIISWLSYSFAPPTCDDTTVFKSPADLIPLSHLKDFYLCHATKEVPGLGSMPWTANVRANIDNTKLVFTFHTGLPYLQSLLFREGLSVINVPMEIGMHSVYGSEHYLNNPLVTYGGYGRLGADGDVSDGEWSIDTLCVNYLEITHLDFDCMEAFGNFEVHLKMLEQGQFGVLYSERINFLNGKFEARIFNF